MLSSAWGCTLRLSPLEQKGVHSRIQNCLDDSLQRFRAPSSTYSVDRHRQPRGAPRTDAEGRPVLLVVGPSLSSSLRLVSLSRSVMPCDDSQLMDSLPCRGAEPQNWTCPGGTPPSFLPRSVGLLLGSAFARSGSNDWLWRGCEQKPCWDRSTRSCSDKAIGLPIANIPRTEDLDGRESWDCAPARRCSAPTDASSANAAVAAWSA